MVGWFKRTATALAVAVLLSGFTLVAAPAHAEEAVLVPGATVFKRINPLYPLLADFFYPVIGEHMHDDANPVVVDYSQNALASDRAIRQGVDRTLVAVANSGDDVVVIGESMGSMVASRVAVALDADPEAPDNVRVVLIAPPEAGVAQYFPEGTFIPILNYRITAMPLSSLPTDIVIGEYDFWADPPDRPWNLPALVNSIFGMAFVHGPPIAAADLAEVPPENITKDENITTYLVPTPELPITQPLRIVGVPDTLVDKADRVLRPVINAGYRRYDKPGDSRPYLHRGRILRDNPGPLRQLWSQRQEQRDQLRTQPAERLRRAVGQLKQKRSELRDARSARAAATQSG